MNTMDVRATFPLIAEDTFRNSPPLPSFSSVLLRNTFAIPELNASFPRDMHIAPRVKTIKLSANIKRSEEMMRNTFEMMSAVFCHHLSAIIPAGSCMIMDAR